MEGKLKILMTTDTVGGVWVYSLELCKALQKHNVQVHLVAMGHWPTEEQESQVSAINNVTLYKSDYKLEWMEDPWEDVEKARKWINCIYHTVYPDVVHLNNYALVGKDWECPTISVFHSCVQTWWQAVKGTTAPETWNKYKAVVKDSLNSSDVVVSPSNAIMEKAIATHNVTSETRVIYNGRDLQNFNPGVKEEIILCIGRIWDEAKNLEVLSKIAEELPWPVFIAGNNSNPSTGKEIQFENVTFLGKLTPSEVKEWIGKAKIFVSPTKYEPFGLAILEAAKAECALVLSEIDTLKEIWQGSALFFDPESPEEAKEAINSLVKNSELLESFSRKALERSKYYNAEKMGAEYFNLYQKTIDKKMQPKLMTL